MNATDVIKNLHRLIEKHGDLEVYTNEKYGYEGESESSGVRFAEEIDDRTIDGVLIDENFYLPNRFYIKT